LFSSFHHVVDLTYLGVDRPSINVFAYDNGRTNIPTPKVKPKPGSKPGLQQLIDLAINRIDVVNGSIHFLDYQIPLDVHGQDFHADLAYNPGNEQYQGQLTMALAANYRAPLTAQIAIPVV